MRGLVIFLLVVAGLSLFSFIALSSAYNKADNGENPKSIEFRTFTSAVCENKGEFVHCRDELFVNCNGKISKSRELEECNGFRISSKVSGFAVFEKEWKDPRNGI